MHHILLLDNYLVGQREEIRQVAHAQKPAPARYVLSERIVLCVVAAAKSAGDF